MRSIQNNPLLSQVNRRPQIQTKINDPTRIREAILDQKKPDQKMDINRFNKIYTTLDCARVNEKEKLWSGRTNQPYKNIFPPEMIKKEYKTEKELIVYTVKQEDKNEKIFSENVDKLKDQIGKHNHELKNTFDQTKKKDYETEFEYNNVLKYKVKYDPTQFEDMKNDITEYYKKEQENQEKEKNKTDNIIESMVGLNLNECDDNIKSNINETIETQKETDNDVVNEQPEQKIQNISTNKYIQRQKKI